PSARRPRSRPARRSPMRSARSSTSSRRSTIFAPLPSIAAASRRICSRGCYNNCSPHSRYSRMRAVVVSLGDLGRSARMLYHARALAATGVDVDLVGFEGTPLPRAIADEPRISVRRLNPATLRLRGAFWGATYAVAGLVDAARLSLRLWRTLRRLQKPDLVL